MAGEWGVTQPLVFKDEKWSHCTIAKTFEMNDDGSFRRWNVYNEKLDGVILYASVHSETVRRSIMQFVADNDIPSWPSPHRLLQIDDRFTVLKECVDAGLVSHPVEFVEWKDRHKVTLGRPYVMKVGNLHQGEGKFLMRPEKDDVLPEYEGVASAEPFFTGVSARALFIGDKEFALRFDNPTSWIKNSAGADVEPWADAPHAMFEHARRVHKYFGLEVSGIDYVVEADGTPRFLEYNQFPGVGATDEIAAAATAFLRSKMDLVEQLAAARREQKTPLR
jgi:glutathione synthase/RimK-type ligase-like ATP-grasp enzyme